ncbi:ARMT1-like domain-containing protein [Prolixibacteraceae bacterium Z1-6]|uniref:ARMT1-like domain-containing protein n=1 Tax=Draconibacterium aestuarii TaxID=2998507 RepID=A0A9X3F705_9BACT|nr:ARMT1-like domain-containing protein [Prolixibacteraceae bacterium Z1-6]
MNYECLICQVKALQKRMDKFEIAKEKRNSLVRKMLKEIATIDLDNAYSPEITRNLLEKLKQNSTITDPYDKEKQQSNKELLERYDEFKQRIQNSNDKFDTALRLAIAGNIIDFGPSHKFDISETIEKVFTSDLAINDSKQLRAEIRKAKTILYLGDNCGEIVLDKLFIETINHTNVVFAVRENPILNDATQKEAIEVGIPEVATLISNGDDAPSTLLHRVSKEFLDIYKTADLIIAKGMGNFEGLMDETDPRLFYMLMIKCQVIGNNVGANKGDFVVKRCTV